MKARLPHGTPEGMAWLAATAGAADRSGLCGLHDPLDAIRPAPIAVSLCPRAGSNWPLERATAAAWPAATNPPAFQRGLLQDKPPLAEPGASWELRSGRKR
eukprot:CAMPEP_0175768444 /NCGR_PEP_ID=MMETSP0097-20121207/70434_1 /TAXON_ID=311494 /ORGANISM="Alexandrium monilatum, Strain CCMP3105" /LENGTH=100 /DNA_ID=CAMNT_0017078561 /DNA_START=71 /DNA_END=370 /DNA_ORIENTATION=+